MKDFIFNLQRFVDIRNEDSNKLIEGTNDADKINNSGSFVTINSGAGNDGIYGYNNNNNVVTSDSGKNIISFIGGEQITVLTGSGSDTIFGLYARSFLSAGSGKDFFVFDPVPDEYTSYGGLSGSDLEGFKSAEVTIVGGQGDDVVYNERSYQSVYNYDVIPFEYLGDECNDSNLYFIYAYGDGKDTITNFDTKKDTLAVDSTVSYNIVESEIGTGYSVVFDDNNSIFLQNFDGNIEDLKIVTVSGGGENNLTYSGGNQTITSYTSGEKINWSTNFTGIGFGGNDFKINSSTGSLTIQNARNKIIDVAVNNNTVAYAYYASGGGNLDGSSFSQLEVIIGGNNSANTITAGSGGSSLWGGAGGFNLLYGGAGQDTFFFGKNDGSVYIGNASSSDVINLYDVSINDITELDIGGHAIEMSFNTGAGFKMLSSEDLSATFQLADGSRWKLNHSSNTWQNA